MNGGILDLDVLDHTKRSVDRGTFGNDGGEQEWRLLQRGVEIMQLFDHFGRTTYDRSCCRDDRHRIHGIERRLSAKGIREFDFILKNY